MGILMTGWVYMGAALVAGDPSEPANPSPADDAIGVDANTSLCVDVADPGGEELTVRFFARDLSAPPDGDFTVIAIPDTQYYSQSFPEIFLAQTEWVVENRKALNVAFVSHLGDVVQLAPVLDEWSNSKSAMNLLLDPILTEDVEGMPYGISVGNHDQFGNNRAGTPEDPGSTTVNFNDSYGLDLFESYSWFGGNYGDNNDNSYQLFEAGGMEFTMSPAPTQGAARHVIPRHSPALSGLSCGWIANTRSRSASTTNNVLAR